jgi:NAD(P)-dependent dehydrogenase (short-subunit alcohol dehydrogenase family)
VDLGLHDRVCVVTGSTGGIGRAVARMLAEEGARVVTSGRSDAPGVGEALHVVADLADPDAPAELIRQAGQVDCLVNNVGLAYQADFDALSDAQWDEMWQLNVMSYIRAIRAVLPQMRERGGGVIVNVSSTSAFSGDINHVAYAASKAGMHSLARSIATSHGIRGIRANAIATGLVLSPTARHNLDQEKLGVYRKNILVDDFATPADIAAIVVFLATDGHYIQGQAIIADGGFQAHQPWHMGAAIVHPGAVAAAAAAADRASSRPANNVHH